MKEQIQYEANIKDLTGELPDMKRATVIITNRSDGVLIGVKTVGCVYERTDSGGFKIHEEQFGDYALVNKSEPVSKIFDCLKEMLVNTGKLILEANKDVKA